MIVFRNRDEMKKLRSRMLMHLCSEDMYCLSCFCTLEFLGLFTISYSMHFFIYIYKRY